jgi:hypothetical protein
MSRINFSATVECEDLSSRLLLSRLADFDVLVDLALFFEDFLFMIPLGGLRALSLASSIEEFTFFSASKSSLVLQLWLFLTREI